MMPPTSRLLYYDLGMNADDDGFCEHFTIMKMTDATPDDLRVLQARGLVKVFDDKVLIIQDWKENNYLQKDRYTSSKYLEIYKEELKRLSSGRLNDNQMYTKCIQNVNTGKVRKGKKSIVGKNADHLQITNLFDYYKQEFVKCINSQPPIFNWGLCEKNAKPYLKQIGLEKLKTMIDLYFKSDDKLYKENAYSLSCFLSVKTLHKLNVLRK